MPSLIYNPDGSPHIHEYTRATSPDGSPDPKRYRCNHPDCSHRELKINLKGKRSLCTVCKTKELILTSDQLKLAGPRCTNCSQSKRSKELQRKSSLLEELFPPPAPKENPLA